MKNLRFSIPVLFIFALGCPFFGGAANPEDGSSLRAKILFSNLWASDTPGKTAPAAPGEERLPDACLLLSHAEVEAAVGMRVLGPEASEAANVTYCTYKNPETPILSVVVLSVFVGSDTAYYAGSEAHARDAFQTAREGGTPITGLGEEAYWSDLLGGSLQVLKGKYWLTIDISIDENGRDAAKKLASLVLKRLPQ